MDTTSHRRPLAMRGWPVIQKGAQAIARHNITPNQISVASVAFAALAAASLLLMPEDGMGAFLFAGLTLLFMSGRALCNVFDGMVAIEGGKSTKAGELFNEIPDRISDVLIFVAAGYMTDIAWGPALGWLTAVLAVMTAYIRALAKGTGAPAAFQGPMGKTNRIIIMALACFIVPFCHKAFLATLALIAAGSLLTLINRTYATYKFLEGDNHA